MRSYADALNVARARLDRAAADQDPGRAGRAWPMMAIHIGAFEFAGYAHVVTALWPIPDDLAAEAAR
jgi:hypothetical protein